MPGRRRGRGVSPRKVFVVELDVGEEVRLEVRDPVARLGLHDRARIDTENVARSEQLDLVADRSAVDVEVDGDRRALAGSARTRTQRIDGVDACAEALLQPRQERVGAKRIAHATSRLTS